MPPLTFHPKLPIVVVLSVLTTFLMPPKVDYAKKAARQEGAHHCVIQYSTPHRITSTNGVVYIHSAEWTRHMVALYRRRHQHGPARGNYIPGNTKCAAHSSSPSHEVVRLGMQDADATLGLISQANKDLQTYMEPAFGREASYAKSACTGALPSQGNMRKTRACSLASCSTVQSVRRGNTRSFKFDHRKQAKRTRWAS